MHSFIHQLLPLISLVLSGIAGPHSQEDALPIKPSEIADRWEQWADELDTRGGVETTTTWTGKPDRKPWRHTVQIDGAFKKKTGVTHMRGVESSSLSIANKYYHAQIKDHGESFALEQLERNSDANPIARHFPLSTHMWTMRPVFIDWLRNQEPASVERDGGSRWKIKYKNPSEKFVSAEFTVNEKFGWLPEGLQLETKESPDFPVLSESYTYEQIADEWLWTKMESELLSKDLQRSMPHKVVENAYDNISQKPIRDECYLAHYGLPEPKFARRTNRLVYILVALASLVVAGFCWHYLKRRNP